MVTTQLIRFVNYRFYENALGLNNNTSIQCKKERSELPDCGQIVKPFMKMDPALHYLPIFHCEHQFYIVPSSFPLLPSSTTTFIQLHGRQASFDLNCPFTYIAYQSTFYHCGQILEIRTQGKERVILVLGGPVTFESILKQHGIVGSV